MNKTALARLMLDWETKRRELDALETQITAAVLELEETFTVGDVRATFNKGRRKYDYQTPVHRAEPDQEIIERFTTMTIDYRGIAKELNLEPLVESIGEPSVTLKIK